MGSFFAVILDHFSVILGSFRGHFGMISASFWDHFGAVLLCFHPFLEVFGAFRGQKKRVIFGGNLGSTKSVLRPYNPILKGHLELSIREETRSNGHE